MTLSRALPVHWGRGRCTRAPALAITCVQVVGAAGLPLSVQIAGLPFQDEVVLRVMRVLEGQVGTAAAQARRASAV